MPLLYIWLLHSSIRAWIVKGSFRDFTSITLSLVASGFLCFGTQFLGRKIALASGEVFMLPAILAAFLSIFSFLVNSNISSFLIMGALDFSGFGSHCRIVYLLKETLSV